MYDKGGEAMIAAEEALKEQLKTSGKNIFVVAGAGAGKSTLMVERLIEQATSGRQLFKHTVAITFTNKAAMELEGKLMSHLLKIDDPVTRERLLAQRNDLTIVTIHAFCQQLLAERPIEAGLNPNFTVIEEPEAEALFTSVLLDYYDGEFAGKNEADAILRVDDYSMDVYAPMLYTQAKYRELGLEEAHFQAGDLEEAEAAQREFLATVEAAVMNHAKHVCVGLAFKLLPCLKIPTGDNAGLPLGELIARIYMEADHMEAGLAVLFGKNDLPGIMKVLRDTYSESELAKEVLVDGEDFTEVVLAYLFEMFTEQVGKLVEKGQLSVETLIKKAGLDEVLEMDGEWADELDRLLGEADGELQLEALFHHLFVRLARRQSVRDLLTNKSRTAYDQIKPADYMGFADLLTANSYSTKAYDPALLDVLSDYRKQRFFYRPMGEQVKSVLLDVFQQVMDRYEAAKLDRNIVTQNDLLFRSYQLLQNESVRQYFHEKYRYIYVDECQDTDPLQTKMLFYLTAENTPTSIADAKPREGSLFLVGDPKQSIYRFRNADLRIYDQIYRYAKESNDWIVAKLHLNYRSERELIAWFNRQFDPLFAVEDCEEMQPLYDEMVYYDRENEAESVPTARIYKLPTKDDELSIANWIEANCGVESGAYTYEDIMIITPTTKKVIDYVKALKARGIPTSFSGKVVAHSFPELVQLTDLVDYVASPNSFKWYKLLAQNWRLPFSLLKEYKDSDEAGKEDERFQSIHFAAKQLAVYREMIRSLRPMEILSRLIYKEQFGIFDPKLTEVDYESSLSILTTFMEKVRLQNPQTLTSLADQMKRLLKENIEYEISADGQTNAVRIMNLHKTKGLEAKVVFLAGPTKPRPKGNYTSILTRDDWEEELEFALYASWPKLGTEKTLYYRPSFYDKFADELRQDEAERVRELYVAATRAMEMLIITECSAHETWYDLLSGDLPYLPVAEVSRVVPEEKYLAITPVTTNGDELGSSQQPHSFVNSYRKVSPSDGAAFVKGDANLIGIESDALSESAAGNAPYKGPLWGSLVHAGIECVLKNIEASVDDNLLKEVIARGLMQYDLTDEELFHLGNVSVKGRLRHERLKQLQEHTSLKAALQAALVQVMGNDFFGQLLVDYDYFTEVPFTAWLEAEAAAGLALKDGDEGADNPVHLTGIIDLVLRSKENPSELIIIDYKTDRMEEGESVAAFRSRLLAAYQHQLRAYRSIMARMSEVNREITVYVYAVSLDEFILFG